jgi:hypothetical protein
MLQNWEFQKRKFLPFSHISVTELYAQLHNFLLTRERVGRVTLSLPWPRLSLSVSKITWPSSLRITTCGSADDACTMGEPRSRGMCCTCSTPCSSRTPICDTCTPQNSNICTSAFPHNSHNQCVLKLKVKSGNWQLFSWFRIYLLQNSTVHCHNYKNLSQFNPVYIFRIPFPYVTIKLSLNNNQQVHPPVTPGI